MRTTPLSAARAAAVFQLLTLTRWFPVGLVIGVHVLIPLQRGLDITQIGVAASIQGFVMLGLELPTGGLSDVLGRRPVMLAAALLQTAGCVIFMLAPSFWWFVASVAVTLVLALIADECVDGLRRRRPDRLNRFHQRRPTAAV